VHLSCQVSHVQKIVMDGSFLDEYTSSIGDKLIHVRCESRGHHLGD
jgi:hypothetical protein